MNKPHTLIVGGSKGIGESIAQKLLSDGHKISIISRKKPENISDATYYQVDLSDKKSVAAWIQSFLSSDVTLNNIIFAQRFRGNNEIWEGEINTSLTATQSIIEGLKNKFADSGEKTITIISSMAGDRIGDSQPVGYHVSKAGLEQIVKFYSVNLGKLGIRVNAISPSMLYKDGSKINDNKELMEAYKDVIPLGRMLTSTEVAKIASFIVSDQASYLTGNILNIDGGLGHVCPETITRKIISR